MSSKRSGTSISHPEVTCIGASGLWLLIDDREYFVPFSDYPVFRRASVEQILAVQLAAPGQLHWPDLDADIELDALEHPEHYPLAWNS